MARSLPLKPASASLSSQEAPRDPVLNYLWRKGLPLTKENYRAISGFKEFVPDEEKENWLLEMEQDPTYADLPER